MIYLREDCILRRGKALTNLNCKRSFDYLWRFYDINGLILKLNYLRKCKPAIDKNRDILGEI